MKDLNKLTIKQAVEALKNKEITSVQLVSACFDQIEKYDSKIKAFVTLNKTNALEKAEQADKIIKSKSKAFELQPLLGIPYSAKDNYSTKGIKTTASAKILENYIPPFESTVTKKLNEAGAILTGKTNMDAFAHGSSTETSDFFSTRNPWNIERVPGGSSGGSTAAVAADMCVFAVGSETAGSIRGPASWCGVTGLKPSYGRVSRYGLIAMASSTDSPGPITKTVEDSAYVLNVIAGKDDFDGTTSALPVDDYFKKLNKFSLKGLKIGKPKSYFEIQLEPGTKKRVEESFEILKDLGAKIVDVDLLSPKYSIAVYTILQRSEVSSNLARLDGIRYGHPRSYFSFQAKKRMLLGAYTLSHGYYDEYYAKAQKVRTLIVNDFNKVFEKVDILAAPSMPCVAVKSANEDKASMFGELIDLLNEPSSIAGLCGVSVVCGLDNNLPVGLQFMGKMFDETKILSAANQFQQKTKFHLERPKI